MKVTMKGVNVAWSTEPCTVLMESGVRDGSAGPSVQIYAPSEYGEDQVIQVSLRDLIRAVDTLKVAENEALWIETVQEHKHVKA